MWSFQIFSMDAYHFVAFFMIYSFLGWLMESIFVSINQKEWVNRGFVNGPFCPIYGVGVLLAVMLLSDFSDHILVLYAGGFVIATIVEYVIGALLEHLFHATWWDYSDIPFNIKGRVCLLRSAEWGVLATLVVLFLHSVVSAFVDKVPRLLGETIITAWLIGISADVCITVSNILQIHHRLELISSLRTEWKEKLENLRLFEEKKSALEKLENAPFHEFFQEIKEKLEEGMDELEENSMELRLRSEYVKKEVYERMERYLHMLEDSGRIEKRLLRAFPHLNSKNFQIELEQVRREMGIHINKNHSDKRKRKDHEQ